MLREMMVMIRIWGLLKPGCLPIYTATSDNQDSMSLLFRLLTKLWLCCKRCSSHTHPSHTHLSHTHTSHTHTHTHTHTPHTHSLRPVHGYWHHSHTHTRTRTRSRKRTHSHTHTPLT